MPLDLLGQVERPETRAVTPGTTDDATDAIAPYVFERTICERLAPGCIRKVPTGPYFSVTMTTPPAAAATVVAKDADAIATAGAFTLAERRPVRLPAQGGVSGSRTRPCSTAWNPRSGCRSPTELLTSAADEVVINGKASNPDFDGLFDAATDVARPSADQGYGAVRSHVLTHVDGRYAYGPGDLRIAIGSTTYGLMEGLYQSNGDISVYESLMAKLGALVVSNRMPNATNSNKSQKGLLVPVGRWRPAAVSRCRCGNRLALVRDEYTAAKKGQVVLTVNMLLGAPVVRYGTDVLKQTHYRFRVGRRCRLRQWPAPLGGGKSQWIARRRQPGDVLIDFTSIWAAMDRRPAGPPRPGGNPVPRRRTPRPLPMVSYLMATAVRYAVDNGLSGYVTTSQRSKVAELERQTGQRAAIIDPGADVVRERLLEETGELPPCAVQGMARWYG